jgi:hypothetical protein
MAARKGKPRVARSRTKSGARPRCACGHAMSSHAKRANDCRAHGCKCVGYSPGAAYTAGLTPAEYAREMAARAPRPAVAIGQNATGADPLMRSVRGHSATVPRVRNRA